MIFKKFLLLSWLFLSGSSVGADGGTAATAFNLPDEIVRALNYGDAKTISKYFNTSVELIFNETQGIYGKAQAEQILKNFFTNNAPANGRFTYKHLHGSDRDNVQYYIGELHTGKGLYRVYIHMKNQFVYQMRIESND